MPGLLNKAPLDDAERIANDNHRPWVVMLVLAVLSLYFYFFTYVGDPFGAPRPQDLAQQFGVTLEHVFDDDRNVDSNVGILMTQRYASSEAERLVFLLMLCGAFLSAYFLPLRHKRTALVVWTTAAIWFLYGPQATAGLLMAHLLVYLALHAPSGRRGMLIAAAVGAGAYAAFVDVTGVLDAVLMLGLPVATGALYRHALYAWLASSHVSVHWVRSAMIHLALLVIGVSVLLDALGGDTLTLSLGMLLFCWQWARLVMYHIDYRDGLVPSEISLREYLSVFISPGVIPNWSWGGTIPQGYAYLNNHFLSEDKNRIILGGAKLLLIALFYLVFWSWIHHALVDLFNGWGIETYGGYTRAMVRAHVAGDEVATTSVLLTTLLDMVRFMMFFAGVVHFKVALWRICGYAVEPYYNKPWLATNLINFWGRFAYHYREFLARAFYYPTFFRFFRRWPNVRIFMASMAAAGLGNLIWHITERVFFRDMDVANLAYVLGTWPYFFLLGIGIGVTQLYLRRVRRTRKPWTLDLRLPLDVVAMLATWQYFSLIHIFARPVDGSSVGDLFVLFMRGFGVDMTSP